LILFNGGKRFNRCKTNAYENSIADFVFALHY